MDILAAEEGRGADPQAAESAIANAEHNDGADIDSKVKTSTSSAACSQTVTPAPRGALPGRRRAAISTHGG
jgi:hypothetical protein